MTREPLSLQACAWLLCGCTFLLGGVAGYILHAAVLR